MLPEQAVTVKLPLDMVRSERLRQHVYYIVNRDRLIPDLPAASGLRAHIKLSIILNEIANDVYGTAGSAVGYSHTISRVDAALEKLLTRQAELPSSLQLLNDGFIPDRARLTLHMNHNQARISGLVLAQTSC